MKKILVFVMVIFIAGCHSFSFDFLKYKKRKAKTKDRPVPEITTKRCEFRRFKSIVASNDAKVEIVNGPYGIDVTGVHANMYDCKHTLSGQTLFIGSTGGKRSNNMVVKVSAPELERITVTDSATISTRDFKASNLTIIAKGRGSVDLDGEFDIEKIIQRGRGKISVDWIYGNSMIIEGYDEGPIVLAGKVDNMVVKLVNDARLYARYLRATKATVFTTDKAMAEILVLDNLGAYAIGRSNIFYYKQPDDITVVTKDSGNVLYPDWMN